ncbi:response regulator [Desulfobacula sp.]|uniref:PAS domain-containing hybrid sensor histidine kinase/response regulator n=1 Tax=Desulfobacula sp. TaxID=2593537 RepID=UPI0026302C01|nr:response regulator [Desulfobacula sp.]
MEKTRKEMQREIDLLRSEIKVAREAAEITADFVVKQFVQTERMLHRFQTADSERQAVLDAATQLSIISTDLDGKIQLFSKGAATLLGYNAGEMVGKCNILSLHLEEELVHYGKQVSGIPGSDLHDMKVFDQFVKQKRSLAQEWFYVCKDGRYLPVSLSITSLYDPEGRVVGYLFTAMDMTLQKQMEGDLIKSKEIAESANASKGNFLARMSHEIRTPMNGIIGMASLLKKTAIDPKQQHYLEKLIFSANTLLRLINDILDFSKIDAGKLQLEAVPFNFEDILGNIANVVGMQAEEKGVEFLFQIDSQIPYNLIGDPLRLGQVLMNLAGNAVKFTDQGEIVISVAIDERSKNELTLRFSIRDSGIGLTPEKMKHLFTEFGQADDSITRKYGGTGLGLAICKQLTELMNGKIWVESELGKGSQFIFTAKLRISEETLEHEPKPTIALQGLRALVVDDNQAARDVLSSMLTSLKIHVDTAVDGKSAIGFLEQAVRKKNPYDVVLLDWIMPGIDGIETARRIKANTSIPKVPAMLMVTANGREEAYVEANNVGINAFLLKPVYASVMYNTLLEILGIKTFSEIKSVKGHPQIKDLKKIQGSKILLVDDNSINQEVAREFLEDAGMVVTIASSGLECIKALDHASFDLVLMDIQMPEMDGIEATIRIRQNKQYQNLPIIAMTAHAMTGDRQKSLDAGMNEHITKPIDLAELYQTLKNWIPEKQSQALPNYPQKASNAAKEEPLSLPYLAGIDQALALKTLDNKTSLFIKMLYDFKENFGSEPACIRELSAAGNWLDIQHKAHTLVGIASYIGAAGLMETAKKMEDALENNRQGDAVALLPPFITALEEIISSLAGLPCTKDKSPVGDGKIQKRQVKFTAIEAPIQVLIRQLENGEIAAEDQFAQVEELLEGVGLDNQLKTIFQLIDDIEYERAAEMAQKLLNTIQHKDEN